MDKIYKLIDELEKELRAQKPTSHLRDAVTKTRLVRARVSAFEAEQKRKAPASDKGRKG